MQNCFPGAGDIRHLEYSEAVESYKLELERNIINTSADSFRSAEDDIKIIRNNNNVQIAADKVETADHRKQRFLSSYKSEKTPLKFQQRIFKQDILEYTLWRRRGGERILLSKTSLQARKFFLFHPPVLSQLRIYISLFYLSMNQISYFFFRSLYLLLPFC